jgi:polyhydroxyalkanoate synthesis repressor PhaR
MIRIVKRYESRKLYDTEESRYVSLDEIAIWVRAGQEVQVVDNSTSQDVTAQTLAQIILEEGRNGRSRIPADVLRDLVRFGERTLTSGVEHVQQSMDKMVKASIDRLGPVRQAREEMTRLRSRLEELEESLADLEASGVVEEGELESPQSRAPSRKTTTRKKASPKRAK